MRQIENLEPGLKGEESLVPDSAARDLSVCVSAENRGRVSGWVQSKSPFSSPWSLCVESRLKPEFC